MNKTQIDLLVNSIGTLSFIEIIQVAEGVRPACRITLPLMQEHVLEAIADELALYFKRSIYPLKILSPRCQSAGFDLNSTIPQQNSQQYFYYVSGKKELSFFASMLDVQNPAHFASVLGYPQCCIDYYVANASAAKQHDFTYLVRTVEGSKPSYFLNRITKCFGYSLISHFPCCWTCLPSIELARNALAALHKIAPEIAHRCLDLQNSNVFYSSDHILLTKYSGDQPIFLHQDAYMSYGTHSNLKALLVKDSVVHLRVDEEFLVDKNYLFLPFALSSSLFQVDCNTAD